MSDLQIGLVVLGVLLILGVLGFNWWQDRRARQHMEARFPKTESDPLLIDSAELQREPERLAAQGTGEVDSAQQDDTQEADPACEVVIDVLFAESVSGAAITASLLGGSREIGGKPVRIFAKTVAGTHRARLLDDEQYVSLQLALLLANRSGPISAIEWSYFWGQAERLAESFDAVIDGPEQDAVLEQARGLDKFCASLDVQVGLTLVMADPQPTPAVLAVAREMGFSVDDRRMLWISDTGQPRFSVTRADAQPFADHTSVDRLLMLLDVPLSPPDERPFGRLAQVGRELAAGLDAQLVDDQDKPVQEGSESIIDAQLVSLYAKLEQAGMAAGSERAARVFS